MSECVSKRSKVCTGIGNENWQGMCSNCADERDKPSLAKKIAIRQAEVEKEYAMRREAVRELDNPDL
jgi:hypothetical protein